MRTGVTVLICCAAISVLTGCGSGGDSGSTGSGVATAPAPTPGSAPVSDPRNAGTPAADLPTIVSAEIVDSLVRVEYRIPGADGGPWPQLLLSTLEPEAGPSPYTEPFAPVEAEGEVTMSHEVGPDREVVVFGSVFYEDGKRLYLPDAYLHSPRTATGDHGEILDPATARRNCAESKARISPPVRCES